jgi:pantoate kinase
LNLPSRPIPTQWAIENRGGSRGGGTRLLKEPSKDEVLEMQEELARKTGLRVVSRYRQ